jgi:MoaA/NifB/PqqE/SkfB family radical SAM enzyme
MLGQFDFEPFRPLRSVADFLWRRHFRDVANLWLLHPRGSYFISRGGRDIPPPVYANLALTNKCNLRCEICGSQKYLDQLGIVRSHMSLDRFEAVAATLFPLLAEVELNSQGDPLLYPHIETVVERINQHRCTLKVQTNGTLFTDRIIELLRDAYGIVMLSLDAVGARFDEVRKGGVWEKTEPNLLKFLRSRDPRRLQVGLYPTVTRRTLQDINNVVEFAVANGVEAVRFHRYSPIENSFEEEPTPDEQGKARDQLRAWLGKHGDCVEVWFDGIFLNSTEMVSRRKQVASWRKYWIRALAEAPGGRTYPMDVDMAGAHPTRICSAPDLYVEIGIDGQISTCCRAQDVVLGYATSVEEFAEVWFGKNYQKIRRSLDRDTSGPLPLLNCEPCLRFYAPKEASHRKSLKYDGSDNNHPDALDPNATQVFHVDMIQKRDSYGYAFRLPPKIDSKIYELWENQTKLGPADSPLAEIFNAGNGRYSIVDRELFFSSSDNSDARKNGRSYFLAKRCSNGA